jgi:hypothetical protein
MSTAESRGRCCTQPPAPADLGPEAKRRLDTLELHDTPKHGSWLNIAEIERSALSRQCLDCRVLDSAPPQGEVAAWQERRNTADRPVDWRFTTEDARIEPKRLYLSSTGVTQH